MKTTGREAFMREWKVFRDNRVSCFILVVTFRTQSQRRIWSHYSFSDPQSVLEVGENVCWCFSLVLGGRKLRPGPGSRSQLVSNQWETVMAHWKQSCRRPSWRESFLKNSLKLKCCVSDSWTLTVCNNVRTKFEQSISLMGLICGILLWYSSLKNSG